jgi:hypothetical protein
VERPDQREWQNSPRPALKPPNQKRDIETMTTDNKLDLNTPVSEAEIQERLAGLNQDQLQQVRDQQILDAIKAKQDKAKEPDWGRLTDGEFLAERMRRYGF